MNPFKERLASYVKTGKLTEGISKIIFKFYQTYLEAVEKNGYSRKEFEPLIIKLAELSVKQLSHPFRFEPYHRSIRKPFDFYAFGLDFIRPLIDLKRSTMKGLENLDQIQAYLAKGENVILFANHQTEPDPQVISILLEEKYPGLAEEMIIVAGHRVTTDPLAVPLSKGCNLLCIYSKKHIEYPPEQKTEKLLHNQRTLKKMNELLAKGGKCIYVAPSGGRDRPDKQGKLDVAKFDPQSIDLFLLYGERSKKPCHFYPLALATYALLPPPNSVEKEIGERRHANSAPVHLCFGKEIDVKALFKESPLPKKETRKVRADAIWSLVQKDYEGLVGQ